MTPFWLAASAIVDPHHCPISQKSMVKIAHFWIQKLHIPGTDEPRANSLAGRPFSTSTTRRILGMTSALDFFAWRKTSDQREAVLATDGFAGVWVAQATGISYPRTGF